MRDADRQHLSELLHTTSHGTLTRSDAVSLLIMTRGQASRGSSLRDLGDGIAHDERNRGEAFEELRLFARQVVRTALHGGQIEAKTLYPIDPIIESLAGVARKVAVPFEVRAAYARRQTVADSLAAAVDGTTFTINKMVRAELKSNPPQWVITPLWDVRGDALRLYREIGFAGPLFLPWTF
ncbi:hypothetical protein AB6V29_01365 [Microbacterium sp. 20-116]|uniref:hypothetical protein n=1 Tax=Microbacterium sp. 20-116 TaxID=3239883 RepID=UPI0034E2419D